MQKNIQLSREYQIQEQLRLDKSNAIKISVIELEDQIHLSLVKSVSQVLVSAIV